MQISVISMKVLMESIKSDKMVKGRGGLPLCRTAGRRENTAAFLAEVLPRQQLRETGKSGRALPGRRRVTNTVFCGILGKRR